MVVEVTEADVSLEGEATDTGGAEILAATAASTIPGAACAFSKANNEVALNASTLDGHKGSFA